MKLPNTFTLIIGMPTFPMVTWNHKPYGSIMLHVHCHGKMDEHNTTGNPLIQGST